MSNKNAWVWTGLVVLVLIVGVIIYENNKTENTSTTNQSQQNSDQTASSTPTSTPAAAAPKPSSAYTKALTTYKYRLQFSQCHGVDNIAGNGLLSIKQGQVFMIDNRDPEAHTYAFKGYSHKVAGYGYAIATATVLGEYPITCDGGGAAKLNVEK